MAGPKLGVPLFWYLKKDPTQEELWGPNEEGPRW